MPAIDSRSINAAIRDGYNQFVYDSTLDPLIDVGSIRRFASEVRSIKIPRDALDLGCGTGALLEGLARQVEGEIVGVDISPQACNLAREKISKFGNRTKVICADLLDIDSQHLGKFDFISCIGVIYIAPAEVQYRIIDIIANCLRSGGVAVISYYAGTRAALRANLYQMLRVVCKGLQPRPAIKLARGQLEYIKKILKLPDVDILQQVIAAILKNSDLIFFHEELNSVFEPIRTTVLEEKFSKFGVSFAGYLSSGKKFKQNSSTKRAVVADLLDFINGQYRYAVFIKDAS